MARRGGQGANTTTASADPQGSGRPAQPGKAQPEKVRVTPGPAETPVVPPARQLSLEERRAALEAALRSAEAGTAALSAQAPRNSLTLLGLRPVTYRPRPTPTLPHNDRLVVFYCPKSTRMKTHRPSSDSCLNPICYGRINQRGAQNMPPILAPSSSD